MSRTIEQKELHDKKWNNQNNRNGILSVSKKSKTNKQNLSRYAVATRDIKDKDIVYIFEEETQDIMRATAEMKNNEIILKDEKGFIIRFIDIIFRTEAECKKYRDAPFM